MDYKPINYTTKPGYVPVNDINKMDPRPKLYQPKNPITPQDMTKKPRTYDTEPPKYIKAKPYEKVTPYTSYREYVPPWSRDRVKVKKERPPPKPKPEKKKKPDPKEPEKKKPDPETKGNEEPVPAAEKATPKKAGVTFAPTDGPSPSATGSIMRSLMLYGNMVSTGH